MWSDVPSSVCSASCIASCRRASREKWNITTSAPVNRMAIAQTIIRLSLSDRVRVRNLIILNDCYDIFYFFFLNTMKMKTIPKKVIAMSGTLVIKRGLLTSPLGTTSTTVQLMSSTGA